MKNKKIKYLPPRPDLHQFKKIASESNRLFCDHKPKEAGALAAENYLSICKYYEDFIIRYVWTEVIEELKKGDG